jgi:hypothetical protein
MEKGKEYFAKIIGKENEFLISQKFNLLGRKENITMSKEKEGK